MKKFLFLVILNFTFIFFAYSTDKIAVINVSNILQQLPERIEVARGLENEFHAKARELQREERELEEKIKHLQRDSVTMKSVDRIKIEKDILKQKEFFEKKAQLFEQENRRRHSEERNKILKKIQEAVNNIVEKQGYDIVLDTDSIVYASKSKDITTDVLDQVKKLNAIK